jgi:hypothetical protein
MSDLVKAGTQALEAYIAAGDIGRLNPDQRIALYRSVCQSLGLNELTQPFQYLTLSGKTVLYATKSCTEQLRQIHGVSVVDMAKEKFDDIMVVTVKVRDKTGREDIATGAVSLGNLRGEALSNAYMKAETKAKRRATLSICGLAVLDETETDSIEGAKPRTVDEFHAGASTSSPDPKSMHLLADAISREAAPAKPAKPVESTATRIVEITPNARLSVVTNAQGLRIFRIDQDGEKPLAITDEQLATQIEANCAFNVVSRVRVEARGTKSLIVGIEPEEERLAV